MGKAEAFQIIFSTYAPATMRFHFLTIALCGLLSCPLLAQDNEKLANDLPETQVAPDEAKEKTDKREESILPDFGAVSSDKDKDKKKKKKEVTAPADAKELDLRIRFRDAKTKAQNKPDVQSAWAESREAETDYDRREALKRYYTALYGHILKSDKSLAKFVEERKSYQIKRLTQNRIDPTDPIQYVADSVE